MTKFHNGAGLFQRARRTKEQAAGRGTSRYPDGIKSWPEPIGNWILMKIFFLRHKISYFWWKIAIVWAILGHFWHVFTDFFVSVTQLCSLWEPFQPEHSWPTWGHGLKPFQAHWAINPWLGSVKNGSNICDQQRDLEVWHQPEQQTKIRKATLDDFYGDTHDMLARTSGKRWNTSDTARLWPLRLPKVPCPEIRGKFRPCFCLYRTWLCPQTMNELEWFMTNSSCFLPKNSPLDHTAV